MSGSERIWVIDVEDKQSSSRSNAEQSGNGRKHRASSNGTRPNPLDSRAYRSSSPADRKYFAILYSLTYLLGPFAILLTERGRRSWAWAAAGVGAGIAGLVLLIKWQAILALVESGVLIRFWSLVTLFLVLVGFSVWSWTVYLAGDASVRRGLRWPPWLMKPWSLVVLGLVVPGLGLLIVGARRRAAAVIWAAGPVVLSILALVNAGSLWSGQRAGGRSQGYADTLEYILLVAGLVTVLGVLGWIIQSLEAARWVSAQERKWGRRRGDWYGAALLAAVVVLALVSDPAGVAIRLDRVGRFLHQEGYQVIPLGLNLAASRLDPSQPVYTMQAIAAYEERGEHEKAVSLRADLEAKMQPYLEMVARRAVLSAVQEDRVMTMPYPYFIGTPLLEMTTKSPQ